MFSSNQFGKRRWANSIMIKLVAIIVFQLALTVAVDARQQTSSTAESKKSMAATVHPIATDAALWAFNDGGNAIDAAIAAGLTLGVVDGFNSGIGGGCFILIHKADGTIIAIDGRETAPAAATRDMYLRDGKAVGHLSQTGPLAVAVPGALKAYERAVAEAGELKFSLLVRHAGETADNGFEVTTGYSALLKSQQKHLAKYEGSLGGLLKSNSEVYREGELLKQPDLAKTYLAIASQGTDWFYQGEFAKQTESWMKRNGGILTAQDFADYKVVMRNPVRTTYRGYEVCGFPPPSSGGVHVAQILNILENFDLHKIEDEDPVQFLHIVAEAMKLAFADRAYWLGDPAYAKVPRGLVDKGYGRELASRIKLDRATEVASHGTPPLAESDLFKKHTTHIATADAEGNWVAITTTVNTTFGSKVVVPGLGVVLNNQMDDFSIAPGVPNAFGLVGAEANSVAPGKRPLSSMSPTIILKDGKPVMTVGAAGGPKIITQAVLAIVGHLDLKMPIAQAVGSPRIHHQWSPDKLFVEHTMLDRIGQGLKRLGHRVESIHGTGITQAIVYDPETGKFTGVYDPRTRGKAAGR